MAVSAKIICIVKKTKGKTMPNYPSVQKSAKCLIDYIAGFWWQSVFPTGGKLDAVFLLANQRFPLVSAPSADFTIK